MFKDGAYSYKCTKIETAKFLCMTDARKWCFLAEEDFDIARDPVRAFPAKTLAARICAGLAHRWHRSCFIGADRFVLTRISVSPRRFRGGRAGTGQLDWAAAESAEFVNQEIGYE
jgi:hypothetical protein